MIARVACDKLQRFLDLGLLRPVKDQEIVPLRTVQIRVESECGGDELYAFGERSFEAEPAQAVNQPRRDAARQVHQGPVERAVRLACGREDPAPVCHTFKGLFNRQPTTKHFIHDRATCRDSSGAMVQDVLDDKAVFLTVQPAMRDQGGGHLVRCRHDLLVNLKDEGVEPAQEPLILRIDPSGKRLPGLRLGPYPETVAHGPMAGAAGLPVMQKPPADGLQQRLERIQAVFVFVVIAPRRRAITHDKTVVLDTHSARRPVPALDAESVRLFMDGVFGRDSVIVYTISSHRTCPIIVSLSRSMTLTTQSVETSA